MRVTLKLIVVGLSFFCNSLCAEDTSVLDGNSFWRVYYTLRPPLVHEGKTWKKLPTMTGETAPPPADWIKPEFDDSKWTRMTGRLFLVSSQWGPNTIISKELQDGGLTFNEATSPALAQICLRANFGVTDPAAVKNLRLNLTYRGGVVVWLNGKEIARQNIASNTDAPEVVADDYPKEAFFRSDGSPIMSELSCRMNDKEAMPAWKLHVRQATLPIPAGALRKGPNTLAIAVYRAPYASGVKEYIEYKNVQVIGSGFLWATCGLTSLSLAADGSSGITANVARPRGLQVWNSQPLQPDFDVDYGDPFMPLRPIQLVGSTGGVCSGKVVVGSDAPLKNLSAKVSDLTGNGVIAAAQIKVRFALPTGSEPAGAAHYPIPTDLCDGLSDNAPAVVDVRVKPGKHTWICGAVCPVWVTVEIPADAKPGNYTGKLNIAAEGAPAAVVPIELKVCGWRVPKPSEFHTIVDLMQSPESVALQYEVPLYGDKHFQLLEKSLDRLGYIGNWTVHIPLICQSNLGNEQSMVRWIKQADGTYKFDFSIMDKYLDLVEKHMGKPRVIFLVVWDFFLGTQGVTHEGIAKGIVAAEDVPVSILEPASGQVSIGTVGRYDQKGKANWEALMTFLLQDLKKRGLDKTVVLGMADDLYPTAEILAFWKQLLPDAKWGRYGHNEMGAMLGTSKEPIGFQGHAWAPIWGGTTSMQGWNRKDQTVLFFRTNYLCSDIPRLSMPVDMARVLGEVNIQGPRRGFGRIGLDFWPVLKNSRGEQVHYIQARYPKSAWQQLDAMIKCFVPPGPNGAMATTKLEMMREGLQETEARILLESVLLDPAKKRQIGDALARKAQQVLDERMRALIVTLESQAIAGFVSNPKPWLDGFGAGDFQPGTAAIFRQWYMESGWQERAEKLFSVAAEVAGVVQR